MYAHKHRPFVFPPCTQFVFSWLGTLLGLMHIHIKQCPFRLPLFWWILSRVKCTTLKSWPEIKLDYSCCLDISRKRPLPCTGCFSCVWFDDVSNIGFSWVLSSSSSSSSGKMLHESNVLLLNENPILKKKPKCEMIVDMSIKENSLLSLHIKHIYCVCFYIHRAGHLQLSL